METKPTEWHLTDDHASKSKFEKFYRNYPREFDSLFANLNKILRLLDGGQKIGGFYVGFFRSEKEGVYRIGQTGVPSAKESRLYVYPDQDSKTMHVLGIGTKESQDDDINECVSVARKIKNPST